VNEVKQEVLHIVSCCYSRVTHWKENSF